MKKLDQYIYCCTKIAESKNKNKNLTKSKNDELNQKDKGKEIKSKKKKVLDRYQEIDKEDAMNSMNQDVDNSELNNLKTSIDRNCSYEQVIEQKENLQDLKDLISSFTNYTKTKPSPIMWSEKSYGKLHDTLANEVLNKGKITKNNLKSIREKIEEYLNSNYLVRLFMTEGSYSHENLIVNIFIDNKDNLVELLYDKFDHGVVVIFNNDSNTTYNFLVLVSKVVKNKRAKSKSNSKLNSFLTRTNSSKSNPFDFSLINKQSNNTSNLIIGQNNNKTHFLSTTANTDELTSKINYNKRDAENNNTVINEYEMNNLKEMNIDELIKYSGIDEIKYKAKSDVDDNLDSLRQVEVHYSLDNPIFSYLDYLSEIKESKFFKCRNIVTANFLLHNGETRQEIFNV